MSVALTNLGRVALREGGDTAEARSSSPTRSSSRRSAATSASPPSACRGSARSSASGGDGAQAARLFGACDALLEAIGATPTTIEVALNEQFIPSVKTSLGEERFTAEWVAGRAEEPEEAIERASVAAAHRRVAA